MILEDGHVELPAGTMVEGRLRIVEDLARGSMSTVYLAEESATGRALVLKVLGGKYATRADAKPRLLAEQRYTSALRGHPGVVAVLSTGELPDEDSAPYLVLEYVDGPTLKGYVVGTSAPYAVVLELLSALGRIVGDVHAAGIVHRDIKPANVLVEEDEGGAVQVKLTDFGLATDASTTDDADEATRLTGMHDRPGTKHYMAPEQCHRTDVGTAADVYALGVSAYELLVGEPPWASRTEREVVLRKCDPGQPSFAIGELSLGLPDCVVAAIDGALQREEGMRPSAVAFGEAMRAGAAELRARLGDRADAGIVRMAWPRGRSGSSRRSGVVGGAAVRAAALGSAVVAEPASAVPLGVTEVVPEVVTEVVPDVAVEVAVESAVARASVEPASFDEPSVEPASFDEARASGRPLVLWSAGLAAVLVAGVGGLWWIDRAVTPVDHGVAARHAETRSAAMASAAERAHADPVMRMDVAPSGAEVPSPPASDPAPKPPMDDASTPDAQKPRAEPPPIEHARKPARRPPAAAPVEVEDAASSEGCTKVREDADAAEREGAFKRVAELARRRECWSDVHANNRMLVGALYQSGQFKRCVAAGKNSTNAEIVALVRACAGRVEDDVK